MFLWDPVWMFHKAVRHPTPRVVVQTMLNFSKDSRTLDCPMAWYFSKQGGSLTKISWEVGYHLPHRWERLLDLYKGFEDKDKFRKIWGYEDMRIQGYEDMRIWGYEDMRIWGEDEVVKIWGYKARRRKWSDLRAGFARWTGCGTQEGHLKMFTI